MKWLALALLLGSFVAAGCGGSGDPAPSNASGELEALISRQIPTKVPGAEVHNVYCIHEGGKEYECVASVSGANTYSGRIEHTEVAITATCDERACIWRLAR